jgi:hypothetical protein
VRIGDYSAAPALWTTRLTSLQCRATRQHGVLLLIECNISDNKTRHAHAAEDIICYY